MRKNRAWSIPICVALAAAGLLGIAFATAAPPADKKTPAPSLFAPAQPPAAPVEQQAATPAADNTAAGASSDANPYVKRLDVTFESIDQADAKYDEYFKQNLVYPKVVRAKVRRLFHQAKANPKSTKELDEVIALLRGAIRNGQVQPWMYEAMGLTMQLKGLPKEETERALMSAADFTDDPQAKLAMADYLSRAGYGDRAVDLYQQVGDLHMLHTETFEKVLSLSEQIKDDEAIEWASLGILRRAARRDELTLWKRAYRIAQTHLEELQASGDKAEAKKFKTKLVDALRRDLIVIVRWNGDADIDIMVEEPGGSTCSFRNPRTTGGGVMTGNLAEAVNRSSEGEHSEMYVCPQAYAGKYRVLLRHIWGRIPSGKVTIDIFANQGDGQIGHTRKQIPLTEKPSLVVMELADGRREEPLEQHQLVNDIKTQLAVNMAASNRALLAQQISTVSAAQRTSGSSIALEEEPRFSGPVPPNFGQRRSVGYQPVISLLPEGKTLSVNAVISADRKYVRITALPFFSQVGDVTEFVVGAPGIGTINSDFVNVNNLGYDLSGNIIDTTTGCVLVNTNGDVVNEQPPCDGIFVSPFDPFNPFNPFFPFF